MSCVARAIAKLHAFDLSQFNVHGKDGQTTRWFFKAVVIVGSNLKHPNTPTDLDMIEYMEKT